MKKFYFLFIFSLINISFASPIPMVSAGGCLGAHWRYLKSGEYYYFDTDGTSSHSLALKEDGTVYAWGDNSFGQLGNGTNNGSNYPVQVLSPDGKTPLKNIKMVSAGGGFSVALAEDGTVYAWGRNDFGQLGDGTYENRNLPVKVKGENGIGYLSGIKMISAGDFHVLALKEDGTVYSWGLNIMGQLGIGFGIEKINYPMKVMQRYSWYDEQGPHEEFFELSNIKMVSAGGFHSVALKNDGTVWCWGSNDYGELGLGFIPSSPYFSKYFPEEPASNDSYYGPIPLTNVIFVSAGAHHTLAIKNDGKMWAWGDNNYAQSGIGTVAGGECYDEPTSTLFDSAYMVDGAFTHTIGVKFDGSAWRWGDYYYDWGTGKEYGKIPEKILDGVLFVSAGNGSGWRINSFDLFLKFDGSVWAIGNNESGQLGNGTYSESWSPVRVLGLNGEGYLNLFELIVTPNPFSFPLTAPGSAMIKTFYVKNSSSNDINIGKISFEKEESEFFIVDDYASYKILKPGETRIFKVLFKPNSLGNKKTKIIIPFSDNRKREIYIYGNGGFIQEGVSIEGKVYDGATGLPIPYVRIRFLTDLGCYEAVSDENGYYKIDWLGIGEYKAIVTKEGYITLYQTVNILPSTNHVKDFILYPSSSGGKIQVIDVYTKYDGTLYFLKDTSFPVEFIALIDWANYTPYKVIFKTLNKSYEFELDDNNPAPPSVKIDVGELSLGDILKVKAISGEGNESDEKIFYFIVMKKPISASFQPVDLGNSFYYQLSPIFNLSFINESLSSNLIPQDIPFFGGNSLNIFFTPPIKGEIIRNNLDFSLLNWQPIPAGNIGPVDIEITPYVGITGTYLSNLNNWKWGGYVGMTTNLNISSPPIYLPIPVPIPIYVKGAFLLDLDTKLNIINFEPLQLNGIFDIEPSVRGIFGVGISDALSVEGWLSGGADIQLQYPTPPNLKQVSIVVKAGYTIYFLIWEQESELLEWEWVLYEGKYKEYEKKTKLSNWIPVSRDYLKLDYGKFNGGKEGIYTKGMENGKEYVVYKSVLQSNIFPLPQPKLSSKNGNLYLVYLYDNPDRTSLNRTMAVFSYYNGNEWSNPVPVYDDGTSDFHPDIIVFDDGDAICAWENVKEVLNENSDLNDMISKLEIMVGKYDKNDGKWKDIYVLTNNSFYDRNPILSGDKNDLMCVWIENTGNKYWADKNSPDELYYSKWDGQNWTNPQKICEFNFPVLKMDLSYKNNNGFLVLDCDTDGETKTSNDREIYLLRFENERWLNPERLTNDNSIDANPKLIPLNGGAVIKMVWFKDDSIWEVDNFDMENKKLIKQTGYTTNIADFKTTYSENGKISLIWVEPSEYASDIFVLSYDPVLNIWSEKQNLTFDSEIEKWISFSYYGEDTLCGVYLRQSVETKDLTKEIKSGKKLTFKVPSIISSNLYFIKYTLGNDIGIKEFKIEPLNGKPGDFVSFYVSLFNAGNNPLTNFPIVFLANGNEIGKIIFNEIIKPGELKEVYFEYIIPQTDNPILIEVKVDPENTIQDRNLLNNTASLKICLPDIKVESVSILKIENNQLKLNVRIRNEGACDCNNVSVRIKKGDKNEILEEKILEKLEKGRGIDLIFEISNFEENSLYIIVDEENKIEELDEKNNSFFVSYELIKKGDISEDNSIDIFDVILCLRQAIGIDIPTPIFSDMNSDGEIDIIDVILILRKAIGLD